MLAERQERIEHFQKEAFYKVSLTDGKLTVVSENIANEEAADLLAALCNGSTAVVTQMKKEDKKHFRQSQYLTDEMGESTETLIQMLLGKMPYAEGLEYQPDVSKVLNSKKVSDHHAIIPTMEVAKADIGELKERNRKILYLISARVLTATADPYIYESHKCQITCNYHTFYPFIMEQTC